VITVNARLLVDAERLEEAAERKVASARGFFVARDDSYLARMQDARGEFRETLGRLRSATVTEDGRSALATIERLENAHQDAVDQVVDMSRAGASLDDVSRAFETRAAPARRDLQAQVAAFSAQEERLLAEAQQAASDSASAAIDLVVAIVVAVVLLAAILAFVLTRTLGQQIGTAVGRVQSSSAELQAAASQQASGAKEQATAMSEISTTINELIATSRQIAESAQRVAHIASQTAKSAQAGDATVTRTSESVAAIRRQVDVIVANMLELGKKSQQIGTVLDIVSELAEQTNILAINATIEAAGAGDAGRRFAVVADEIRKLADRVAGSTKEIRALIEDVRGAVNTTVMTTETGSKAVDAGSRQFGEVASSFKQIAELVGTTTEAAREIELSTKQQATAVEQVNVAIANVAQASKETEASSTQTLQTASQLATLSRELLMLVQSHAEAA
jgi:methyl-accepting chemotaxis protein